MKAVCYLQLVPVRAEGRITAVRVSGASQNRPVDLYGGAVPVKVVMEVPLELFDSLVAEVAVDLPVAERVRVTVTEAEPGDLPGISVV